MCTCLHMWRKRNMKLLTLHKYSCFSGLACQYIYIIYILSVFMRWIVNVFMWISFFWSCMFVGKYLWPLDVTWPLAASVVPHDEQRLRTVWKETGLRISSRAFGRRCYFSSTWLSGFSNCAEIIEGPTDLATGNRLIACWLVLLLLIDLQINLIELRKKLGKSFLSGTS